MSPLLHVFYKGSGEVMGSRALLLFCFFFFLFFCCGFVLPSCSCFNYIIIFPNVFFISPVLFLFYSLLLYCSFFSFLLLHHAACRILVPRPGVGPELLWWKCGVQTAGLTENLRPQGILIRMRLPGGPHPRTKTCLYPTACKLQC